MTICTITDIKRIFGLAKGEHLKYKLQKGSHTLSSTFSFSAPCRRSRETGLHAETELEEHEALFDYVEEEEYARIVQQRQEEGFILDDGEKRARSTLLKSTIARLMYRNLIVVSLI